MHPYRTSSAFSHYPFGMVMKYEQSSDGVQGRGFSYTQYRYGFNNQEKDSELGEYYAFEYRIHDARLGRFLSVDPLEKEYPWNSMYCFAENKPIAAIDLEGKEARIATIPSSYLSLLTWNIAIGQISDNTVIEGVSLSQIIVQVQSDLAGYPSNKCNEIEGGWLCGPAVTKVCRMHSSQIKYSYIIVQLAIHGRVKDKEMGINLKLSHYARKHISEMMHSGVDKTMITDFIYGFAIRQSENDGLLRGTIFSRLKTSFSGGTFPWEMDDLLERVGMEVTNSSYWDKYSKQDVNFLKAALDHGREVIILENHMISECSPYQNRLYKSAGVHFLKITEIEVYSRPSSTTGTDEWFVRGKYISYGTEQPIDCGSGTTLEIPLEDFLKGMKGYWIANDKK